jgi:hypothetical protein
MRVFCCPAQKILDRVFVVAIIHYVASQQSCFVRIRRPETFDFSALPFDYLLRSSP